MFHDGRKLISRVNQRSGGPSSLFLGGWIIQPFISTDRGPIRSHVGWKGSNEPLYQKTSINRPAVSAKWNAQGANVNLRSADVIPVVASVPRRERSDDRKYVCASQAMRTFAPSKIKFKKLGRLWDACCIFFLCSWRFYEMKNCTYVTPWTYRIVDKRTAIAIENNAEFSNFWVYAYAANEFTLSLFKCHAFIIEQNVE